MMIRSSWWKAFVCMVLGLGAELLGAEPRARDLGIPFVGTTGPHNAITDVQGVLVGHATINHGEGDLVIGKGPVRTGVTAILPTGRTYRPVFAGWHSFNGNGELTGTAWVEESGFLEEPILLTNTRSVGVVHDAVWSWRMARKFHDGTSVAAWASLPVVGETWDGRLNDIHGNHVRSEHVFQALDGAKGGSVSEGNVGGGTGMVCHRFKGGIGTSSRVTEAGHRVGVLVQANYGLRESLLIAGVPVGRAIDDLMPDMQGIDPPGGGNSILIVIATDAPLLPHQLKRLAKRGVVGLARVGGEGANSSGDLLLAFSTAQAREGESEGVRLVPMLANDRITPLFEAVAQATEEAIVNALVAARTMTGINGNTVHAVPHDRVKEILEQHNRLRGRAADPH